MSNGNKGELSSGGGTGRKNGGGGKNVGGENKVEELREILKIIKDKIVSVEKTIYRKDAEIK